jgi:uncharacterized protein (TIGR03435 family)
VTRTDIHGLQFGNCDPSFLIQLLSDKVVHYYSAEVRIMHSLMAILQNRKIAMLRAKTLTTVAAIGIFGVAGAIRGRAEAQVQNASATGKTHEYEVVSVKSCKPDRSSGYTWATPSGYTAKCVLPLILIDYAFGIHYSEQLSGAPAWIAAERFDVDATFDPSVGAELQKMSKDDRAVARQEMLQALLADRFKLTFHRETRQLLVYTLVVGKSAAGLKGAKPGDTYPNGIKSSDGRPMTGGVQMSADTEGVTWTGQAFPMESLVRQLSMEVRRMVVDKTGLTGSYDFTIKFAPERFGTSMASSDETGSASAAPASGATGPSIFTAVQEQLGLKLQSAKGPVEVIVIDHIERPSGN